MNNYFVAVTLCALSGIAVIAVSPLALLVFAAVLAYMCFGKSDSEKYMEQQTKSAVVKQAAKAADTPCVDIPMSTVKPQEMVGTPKAIFTDEELDAIIAEGEEEERKERVNAQSFKWE